MMMTDILRKLRDLSLIGVVWLLSGIGFSAVAITVIIASERADPENLQQVLKGQSVYGKTCAVCHGKNLEGQEDWKKRKPDGRLPAPPHDETGHTWHHPDDHLFRVTKIGVTAILGGTYPSDMPGFEGVLSGEEIWAALAFIKSKWPPKIRNRQKRMNRLSDP